MQWLLLAALAVILILLCLILSQWRERKTNQSFLQKLILSQQDEKKDLLNRLMSGDLQAYLTMRAMTSSDKSDIEESPYISTSDAAEVERLQGLVGAGGVGSVLLDEESNELQDTMEELGIFADREVG